MEISELIKQLEAIRDEHGEIECYATWGDHEDGLLQAVNMLNVETHHHHLGTYLHITTEGEDDVQNPYL